MRWNKEQDRALVTAAQGGGTYPEVATKTSRVLGVLVSADMVKNRLARLGVEIERPKPMAKASDWEQPSIEMNGDTGVITTGPLEGPPETWDSLLQKWNLDPAEFQVADNPKPQFRAWDTNMGDGVVQRMYYYRIAVVRRQPDTSSIDIDELIAQVRSHTPQGKADVDGDSTFLVAIADLQTGKDEGGGTDALILRFQDSIDEQVIRLEMLRTAGLPIRDVVLDFLGDLIEACSGHYAQQTFRVDRNHRDQMKVVRELALYAIQRFAPLTPHLLVRAVGGNHGENRIGGKSFTNFADNEDVAVIEQVAFALAQNPELYGHVEFLFPEGEDLSIVTEISGTRVGIVHGHQFGSKGAIPWWEGQTFGRQAIGDADILVSAHFHHLVVKRDTAARTWIQAPSLDGGSIWFTHKTGRASAPGLLSFVVGPKGWSNLEVLP